ncbi:hypothetical protein C8R43DRAFT_1064067 [Mycena crocata]|nr:hypothetical protein C8R43DRAFT_1064067 [Mycena crocata]
MDFESDPPTVPHLNHGPQRAEGLWFEHGGLIIQADNSLFRIARDVLAIHSPVFRDMLALPLPTDAEMMDGCPFVRLPDSAPDVTVFLKALYYYDFFEPHPAPATFDTISGVLRMSHKYEVGPLRKRALTHLCSYHPTTLHEWEELGEASPWHKELAARCHFPLLALARQLSLDWMLPIAFYRACQVATPAKIIEGFQGSELDSKDKIRWIAGSKQLETNAINGVVDFLWTPMVIDGCTSPQQCTDDRVSLRRAVGIYLEYKDLPATIALELWPQSNWERLNVCDVCLSAMKESHKEAMQTLWDELPEIFDLPAWSVLEAMRATAFE